MSAPKGCGVISAQRKKDKKIKNIKLKYFSPKCWWKYI